MMRPLTEACSRIGPVTYGESRHAPVDMEALDPAADGPGIVPDPAPVRLILAEEGADR